MERVLGIKFFSYLDLAQGKHLPAQFIIQLNLYGKSKAVTVLFKGMYWCLQGFNTYETFNNHNKYLGGVTLLNK